MRSTVLSWRLAALAFGLLALVFAACGGATASDPEPTATATSTPQLSATSTAQPRATSTAAPPASPTSARCFDPYPGGAPYVPAPGKAIRLRPEGTPAPLPPYEALPLVSDPALEAVVRSTLGSEEPHFAVAVKRLDDGRGVAINAGSLHYAASLYKVWIMLEAFHQREEGLLDFDEQYIVSDYYAGLSLNVNELELCSPVTAAEAIEAMMHVSDNVAANMMLERLGFANTNQALRDVGLLVSGVQDNGDVYTTANGMALVLEAIARGEAVSQEVSFEMLDLLGSETLDDRLPALLPAGTAVAHKTGSWYNATNDAGIVYSPNGAYVIAVLSDLGYAEDGADTIARVSRAVYDYYNPD